MAPGPQEVGVNSERRPNPWFVFDRVDEVLSVQQKRGNCGETDEVSFDGVSFDGDDTGPNHE